MAINPEELQQSCKLTNRIGKKYMENFTKAMVGLDLSAMDGVLMKKVAFLSKLLGIEKIYFIHISKNLSLPEEIKDHYPDILAPLDESIKAEILVNIKEHPFPKEIELEVIVGEGNPRDTILRWANIKDVDIMIMGRKNEMEGSGSLAKYMAQKSPCSVLFLTENSEIAVPKKVLIPLDFSEHSNLTFKFAQKLFEETNTEILALHIYEVPTGYYKTGKSYEEFAAIMKGHAKKDYEKFLQKYKHQHFECLFLMDEKENSGKFITRMAQEHQANWIIMGSRGRTSSASVLLGSVAENLVEANNMLPMLIFKKKGENMNLIDAILKI